jgi:hypothetical protein
MSIKGLNPALPDSNDNAGLGDNEIRNLKSAIQVCFPELEALINNAGASGDPADTDPPDAATFSKLFADVKALTSGLGAVGSVPVGAVMYWGTNLAIPAGWVVCDGTLQNGTLVPAAESLFILSAGILPPFTIGGGTQTGAGGDAGGSVTGGTPLTLADMPSGLPGALSISGTQSSSGSDNHNSNTGLARGQGSNDSEQNSLISASGFNGAEHTHPIGGSSTHQHTQVNPPFIALTPICYVGIAP